MWNNWLGFFFKHFIIILLLPIHIYLDLKKEKDRLEKKLQDTLGKLKKCEQPGAGKKIKYGFSMDRGFPKGCRPFEYLGCGGNQNRFSSKYRCQKKCKGMRRYYR